MNPGKAAPEPGRSSSIAGWTDGVPSIENGYFVFTMMPSLRCSLNCPHCYLSKEQRRNSAVMPVENIEAVSLNVADYWRERGLAKRRIVAYWYGGEPTEMGTGYFLDACSRMERVFPESEGNLLTQTVLTSLMGVGPEWLDVFEKKCGGYVQSSYDGRMRGGGYLRKWEPAAKAAVARGLRLATISVVNRELMADGPEATVDYLGDLGVVEASFLPFMLNEQNEGAQYDKFAPGMGAWDDFMIGVTERWAWRRERGMPTPEIGQMRFILAQERRDPMANIAAQTLFLMPNGDFALPDYKDGWKEYLRVFGNGLNQKFADVLGSGERRAYLRKQALRNGNKDCLGCPRGGCCVMEFWKENKPGDDCFGGRRYVEWLVSAAAERNWEFGDAELF